MVLDFFNYRGRKEEEEAEGDREATVKTEEGGASLSPLFSF